MLDARMRNAPALSQGNEITGREPSLGGILRQRYIIHVNDEQSIVGLMSLIFTRYGFRETGFDTPMTAYHYALEHTPDLFIIDDMMPDICGEELIELILNTEILKNIPIIFMTARARFRWNTNLEAANIPVVIMPFILEGQFMPLVRRLLGMPRYESVT